MTLVPLIFVQELQFFGESLQELRDVQRKFHDTTEAVEGLAKTEAGQSALVPLAESVGIGGLKGLIIYDFVLRILNFVVARNLDDWMDSRFYVIFISVDLSKMDENAKTVIVFYGL